MAPIKASSSSKTKAPSSSISLKKSKGENFYRTAKQVARLKLLNSGKPIRDKNGNIIQAAAFQKGERDVKPGRVQPDRRWFGECHFMRYRAKREWVHKGIPEWYLRRRWSTSGQAFLLKKMTHTRYCYGARSYPWHYSTMPLIRTCARWTYLLVAGPCIQLIPLQRPHIVEAEPFSETFGPKSQRKRPRIDVNSFEELGKIATEEALAAGTTVEGKKAKYSFLSSLTPWTRTACLLCSRSQNTRWLQWTYICQGDITAHLWRTV